jgi:3-oxoacyl-[acyl-carrier-protein] synthase-3
MSLHSVKIAGTGSFLPGPPVSNDRLEAVLGPLDKAPQKIRSFVDNLGRRMLERSGVVTRHLAIDPESGDMTHTFASLAEQAARSALDMARMQPQQIELLVMSCPSYDQSTPPTSALLQERLGIQTCAEMEIHSNCTGVGKSMQVAYDALRTGRYQSALVCYSQLSSVYLRSCYFNQEKMDKVHAALRWILADGAGAVALRATQNGTPGREIIGTYVESVGAGRPPGMVAGGAVADLTKAHRQIPELYDDGRHHLWQDFTAVNDNAAPLLLEGLMRFIQKLGIPSSTVDHYVVSIPTMQLYDENIPVFLDRLGVPRERIKFRSSRVGYCGGSATLLHLDEMIRTGELKSGELAIVHAVESSKWMTAGFAVRW